MTGPSALPYSKAAFPRIVISSEREKSFSLAARQKRWEQGKTGNTVLPATGTHCAAFGQPTSAPSGHLLPREGGRTENAAFPILSFQREAIRECRFSPIVISSECEKSFSFAVKKKREESGKRETPCFMRLGITVLPSSSFTKEKGKRETKKIPRLRSG